MLLIFLRLPYRVCARFICHVLCASSHKHRVCVVLLISHRLTYPVCARFICHILCASPHKRQLCVVLLISLRLPYPVCTRFICHVLCASPHKHQVCVVLYLPFGSHTQFAHVLYYLSCFVCFASQTPGSRSALFALRLPYTVCTRFICHVLCSSPHKHRACVVL